MESRGATALSARPRPTQFCTGGAEDRMAKPLLQLQGALGEGGGALEMRTGGPPRVQRAVLGQGGRRLCLSPTPSLRIQQQSFATGLYFFKEVKKTVTYPATQTGRALAASDMCAE